MGSMLKATLHRTERFTSTARLGSRLLLVRHGAGRGPHRKLSAFRPKSYQPLLDELAKRYPDLRKNIDVWETGTTEPDLADTAAVLFLLSDPLHELYPKCYEEACNLAGQAQRLGIRLVNPPAALSNTIKSRQSELLLAAGVPTARHLAFTTLEEFRAAAREIAYPAIVRADLLHAQQRMKFCRSREEALALEVSRVPLPGSIAEFIDTREGFRRLRPGTLFAKHYHKKRAFVFGDRVVNNHIFFGSDPIVGGTSSTFGHYRSLNPVRRYIQNKRCQEHIEADYEFFLANESDGVMLKRAAAALGLDFVAIDYSSCADGSIVVWELNPHFSLYPWPFQVLARQRKLNERYCRFHETIQMFFRELLGAPCLPQHTQTIGL